MKTLYSQQFSKYPPQFKPIEFHLTSLCLTAVLHILTLNMKCFYLEHDMPISPWSWNTFIYNIICPYLEDVFAFDMKCSYLQNDICLPWTWHVLILNMTCPHLEHDMSSSWTWHVLILNIPCPHLEHDISLSWTLHSFPWI